MVAIHHTGIIAPPLPRFALRRQRLVERLHAGAHQKLTMVVAPPGYGKTILLAHWAAERRKAPSAWLSLDSTDDNATRLARRLVGALETIEPELGRSALERREEAGTALGESFVE